MSPPYPSPPAPELVTRTDTLAQLVERWSRCRAIGFDTEFVRTRTYFPKLGLVQVGDPERVFLIDVVEIDDLSPLAELLSDPRVIKVLHSPSEDLEVLQHTFGSYPEGIFDTQVAATLAGYGPTPGYQRLVEELFGVELPKAEQRSNWLRRPLTAAQIQYAGLDAAFLLPAHERLTADLERLGRTNWAREEAAGLVTACQARLDPEFVVARLLRASLGPRQSAVLRALVRWREEHAARRDLPRNFVVRDEALIEMARRRPRTVESLREVESLRPRELARYGEALLGVVSSGEAIALEPASTRRRSGPAPRGRVAELRELARKAAVELGLPPEFLVRRRWIEELITAVRDGDHELPLGLQGWRRAVVGEALLELASRGA